MSTSEVLIDNVCYMPVDRVSPRFRRGDTDASGVIDISDPIYNLTFQFVGGIERLPCQDAADVDDSGLTDISDPIYSLTFQFVGGIDPPPAPGPVDCGPDLTQDELGCEEYRKCDGPGGLDDVEDRQ